MVESIFKKLSVAIAHEEVNLMAHNIYHGQTKWRIINNDTKFNIAHNDDHNRMVMSQRRQKNKTKTMSTKLKII